MSSPASLDLGKAANPVPERPPFIDRLCAKLQNLKVQLFHRPVVNRSKVRELDEIYEYARKRSDINDHLANLFFEGMSARPRLIVELGVRGGSSTFVLERVARLSGSRMVSCDYDDCSKATSWGQWLFVQGDDVAFGKAFPEWCAARGMTASIDLLYIDTSHLYEHTVQEIESWFPHLSESAKVVFHDTNMGQIYPHRDGSRGWGWDNRRGVIAAIEQKLGASFDEKMEFADLVNGWQIKHDPVCNGFTVLTKVRTG
jgi:cephalosporin hydroxylase